ncbi:hypothetical protein EVAR_44911_1 [Eumeta japonica]|uniref:Uncharacterized protein n=1 Tax=Eumeta variegata TaxID=151549 RepID=A0A4C1XNM3_EUMVA|nr:hypothetical protein EVAR_44911_1 [Eumeta japonica]
MSCTWTLEKPSARERLLILHHRPRRPYYKSPALDARTIWDSNVYNSETNGSPNETSARGAPADAARGTGLRAANKHRSYSSPSSRMRRFSRECNGTRATLKNRIVVNRDSASARVRHDTAPTPCGACAPAGACERLRTTSTPRPAPSHSPYEF